MQTMVKNKGQLKIQQMTFMLLAVTLFFILIGMLVLVYQFSGMKESATRLQEENAMRLVSKIANSPEFSCGKSFGTQKIKCMDFDKIMALKINIDKYQNFWGVKNLEIRKIYPNSSREIECDSGTYPNCNLIRLQGNFSGYGESNFVSLCRKDFFEGNIEDKCELAEIIVSYESK